MHSDFRVTWLWCSLPNVRLNNFAVVAVNHCISNNNSWTHQQCSVRRWNVIASSFAANYFTYYKTRVNYNVCHWLYGKITNLLMVSMDGVHMELTTTDCLQYISDCCNLQFWSSYPELWRTNIWAIDAFNRSANASWACMANSLWIKLRLSNILKTLCQSTCKAPGYGTLMTVSIRQYENKVLLLYCTVMFLRCL